MTSFFIPHHKMINDLQADHKWHSVCRWKAASKTLVDFLGRRRPLSGFVCTDTYRRLKVHLLGRTLLWWFQIQAFFGQPTFSWTWSTYYSLNLIYYCRECKNQLKLVLPLLTVVYICGGPLMWNEAQMNTTCSRLRYVHSSEYYITTRHIMYQNENLVVISKVS